MEANVLIRSGNGQGAKKQNTALSSRDRGHSSAIPSHPAYRADIDGIRALAVLGTVIFHAFPTVLPGGFTGVDIFFVISGFLITRILLADFEHGRYSIAGFYAKRVRRIFPALATVMIAAFGIGWFCLFNGEYKNLGSHMLAGASFISNWALWDEAGYFDKASEMKPLLHLWSLGIEEQFYVFWPLGLAVALRCASVWRALFACMAASFIANLWLAYSYPSAAFYLPGGRAWELLAGAAIAVWMQTRKQVFIASQASSTALSISGIAACLAAYVFLDRSLAFPGIWAVLPVLAACLLIVAGDNALSPSRRWLSHPAVVWIGKISYPLYLWHWPLLSYANIVTGGTPSPIVRTSIVAVSVVLSWGTVALIEKPFRQGPPHWLKVAIPCALMVAVGSTGWMLRHRNVIAESRTSHSQWDFSSASRGAGHEFVTETCGVNAASRNLFTWCFSDDRDPPLDAVWGDSKAEALYWGFVRDSAPNQRWTLLARFSCAPLGNVSRAPASPGEDTSSCNSAAQAGLETLANSSTIHGVVIATAARMLIGPTYEADGRKSNDGSGAEQGLDAAITTLQRSGKRVVLVVDNPTLPDPSRCMDRGAFAPLLLREPFGAGLSSPNDRCAISYRTYVAQTRQYRAIVDQIQRRHPALLVYDPVGILCDKEHDTCPMTSGDKFLYSYGDHISDAANGAMAKEIIALLNTKT